METNFDSDSSASSSAGIDLVTSVCCGTCDCYKSHLPSREVAVMAYCSLRKMPVSTDEYCTAHPQFTGGVPL